MQVEESHVIACLIDFGEIQRFSFNSIFELPESLSRVKARVHNLSAIRLSRNRIDTVYLDRVHKFQLTKSLSVTMCSIWNKTEDTE